MMDYRLDTHVTSNSGSLSSPGATVTLWRSAGLWWGAVLAVLLGLAVYSPTIMRNGVAEPDCAKIVWAITQGIQTDLDFDIDTLMYGRRKNPGYYALFFALYPHHWDLNRLHVVMNGFSLVSMLLAVGVIYLVLARLVGLALAWMSVPIMVLSPVFWNLGTAGHPQSTAMLLGGLGWLILAGLGEPARFGRALAVGVVAGLLMGLSTLIRADMVLFVPVVLAMPIVMDTPGWRGRRGWLIALLVCAVAAAIYLWGMSRLPKGDDDGQTSTTLTSFAYKYISENKHPKHMVSGMAFWAVATTPWVGLAAAAGLAVMCRRRQWRLLVLLMLVIMPASLFFLTDGGHVSRYFSLQMPGVAVLAVYPMLRWRRAAQVAGVAGLVVLGYVSSVLAYHVAGPRYDWFYARDKGHPTSLSFPLGGMIDYRRRADALVAKIHADAAAVADYTDRPVLAVGDRSLYRLANQLSLQKPDATWSQESFPGIRLWRVDVGRNQYALLEATGKKARKWLDRHVAGGAFDDYVIYLFPEDLVAGEEDVIPDRLKDRELRLAPGS